ncbi:hypothetical protein MIND_00759600 [Mycena indigotica]|uniref:Uncharacterized protein n=1 Tax=Mycena indigotica TaxID=2126181 RepID=A0A8H6SN64_9AGAR|nr:uncharacterized protein MIND_00759600 [Mycena indigotica]KAF7301935.1 hypothetical protein MIND_00759600 [Mycena indigotica]
MAQEGLYGDPLASANANGNGSGEAWAGLAAAIRARRRDAVMRVLSATANGCLHELGYAPGMREKLAYVETQNAHFAQKLDEYVGENSRLYADNAKLIQEARRAQRENAVLREQLAVAAAMHQKSSQLLLQQQQEPPPRRASGPPAIPSHPNPNWPGPVQRSASGGRAQIAIPPGQAASQRGGSGGGVGQVTGWQVAGPLVPAQGPVVQYTAQQQQQLLQQQQQHLRRRSEGHNVQFASSPASSPSISSFSVPYPQQQLAQQQQQLLQQQQQHLQRRSDGNSVQFASSPASSPSIPSPAVVPYPQQPAQIYNNHGRVQQLQYPPQHQLQQHPPLRIATSSPQTAFLPPAISRLSQQQAQTQSPSPTTMLQGMFASPVALIPQRPSQPSIAGALGPVAVDAAQVQMALQQQQVQIPQQVLIPMAQQQRPEPVRIPPMPMPRVLPQSQPPEMPPQLETPTQMQLGDTEVERSASLPAVSGREALPLPVVETEREGETADLAIRGRGDEGEVQSVETAQLEGAPQTLAQIPQQQLQDQVQQQQEQETPMGPGLGRPPSVSAQAQVQIQPQPQLQPRPHPQAMLQVQAQVHVQTPTQSAPVDVRPSRLGSNGTTTDPLQQHIPSPQSDDLPQPGPLSAPGSAGPGTPPPTTTSPPPTTTGSLKAHECGSGAGY